MLCFKYSHSIDWINKCRSIECQRFSSNQTIEAFTSTVLDFVELVRWCFSHYFTKMKNRLFLFIFANCLLLSVSFVRVHSFKVVDFDLDIAASDKSEKWDKEDEEDFFDEEDEDEGKKGEKGYDSEDK